MFASGRKFGYLDRSGNVVIVPQFERVESFSEGLAVAQLKGKSGYIDRSGKWVIQPQYDSAGDFSEGLARVLTRGSMGYINKTGRMVIQPQFAQAGDFSEGLASVLKNNESSFINRYGIILFLFTEARWGYSDGLTVVGESPERVYVDKTGKVVALYEVGSQF